MFWILYRIFNLVWIVSLIKKIANHHPRKTLDIAWLFVGSLLLIGCNGTIGIEQNTAANEQNIATISSNINIKNNFTQGFTFQKEDGTVDFYIRPRSNGIKLERAQGGTLANLIVDFQGKINLQTAAGSVLGRALGKDNYWHLEDGEETKILYILSQNTDGSYKLESGKKREIYRIVPAENNGWEIYTAEQEFIYKASTKNNKNILQDANGRTILTVDADFPLLAMACYGFEILDRSQQSGLAYAIGLTSK